MVQNLKFNQASFLVKTLGLILKKDYMATHNENNNNNYFIRQGWMLPRAGIAISFYEKNSSNNGSIKSS